MLNDITIGTTIAAPNLEVGPDRFHTYILDVYVAIFRVVSDGNISQ